MPDVIVASVFGRMALGRKNQKRDVVVVVVNVVVQCVEVLIIEFVFYWLRCVAPA